MFNRESTRALLTQDRLDQATQFVHDAIDKYRDLQGRLGRTGPKDKTKKAKQEDAEAREGKSLRRPVGNDIKEADKEVVADEPNKNSLESKWANSVDLKGPEMCDLLKCLPKIFIMRLSYAVLYIL